MQLQKLILSILLAAFSLSSWAQYQTGQVVRDVLPLDAGRSISLPEGDWMVAMHFRQRLEEAWDVVILRNKLPFAPVQFLVVRVAAGNVGSKDISCSSPDASAFYSRNYRPLAVNAMQQCSRMLVLGPTFSDWKRVPNKMPPRLADVFANIPATDWSNNEAALFLENFIVQPGGRAVEIDAIVQSSMLGVRAEDVQSAFKSQQNTVNNVSLQTWAKRLVSANALSLFANIPSRLEPLEEVHRVVALRSESGYPDIGLAAEIEPHPAWSNDPVDPQEQARMGWAYHQGNGVVQDDMHALELFSRSAEQGSVKGKNGLAWMLADGAGVPREEARALQLFTQLSEQGDFDSTSGLGVFYRDGRSVKKSEQRAFSLFEHAAQNGSAPGQFNLGLSYLTGSGIAKDEVRAAYWLTKASDQGLVAAQRELQRIPQGLRDSANIRIEMANAGIPLSDDKEKIARLAEATKAQNDEQMRVASARRREADRLFEQKQQKLQEERAAEALRKQEQERLAAELKRQQDEDARIAAAKKKQVDEAAVIAARRQAAEAARAQEEKAKQQWYANRKALVIGNDSYQYVNKLVNAVADARAIGKSLQELGYQVTLQLDLNEKNMKKSLRTFRESIQGGDEVLFYYAGHGTQIGASNYLLPIDIQGESESQVKDEAIQLQRILDDMSEQKAKFTLVVVDACRDNPFKLAGRSIGGRGLVPTSAATGQMVIFSAGTGQQALDNLGPTDKNPNGVFMRTFLKEIQKPGVTVDRVLRNVRTQVIALARSIGHEQTPALYDQADGDFYLIPPK